MTLHATIDRVTDRIRERSIHSRSAYLAKIARAAEEGPRRAHLSCGNQAHAYAAMPDKQDFAETRKPNIGIVTAYNDMLSAHQPYERYPDLIRQAAHAAGATAQVAGGVPAMCDGVTQGRPGMELSLFSRDVIALASGVALTHDTFDAALYLGVCDKIVPGLIIAAATFGHIPAVFVPAGPMPSGLPNDEKSKVRQQFATGEVGREALMAAEMASYHAPGTCTFYGTANTNQMLMEFMGLHLPGSSFVNPNTPLRDALTSAAVQRAASITRLGNDYLPAGEVLDERAFVNGIVGLMATGGSTNLVLHLPAMARAAGVILDLEDFHDLSETVPLMARVPDPKGIPVRPWFGRLISGDMLRMAWNISVLGTAASSRGRIRKITPRSWGGRSSSNSATLPVSNETIALRNATKSRFVISSAISGPMRLPNICRLQFQMPTSSREPTPRRGRIVRGSLPRRSMHARCVRYPEFVTVSANHQ